MPDGEFFTGPIEDSVEGEVTLPPAGDDRRARGRRRAAALRGRQGRRRERRARRGVPDQHARHRRGRAPPRRARDRHQLRDRARHPRRSCSTRRSAAPSTSRSAPAIPESGGTNESAVHTDMVCDLRRGGTHRGRRRAVCSRTARSSSERLHRGPKARVNDERCANADSSGVGGRTDHARSRWRWCSRRRPAPTRSPAARRVLTFDQATRSRASPTMSIADRHDRRGAKNGKRGFVFPITGGDVNRGPEGHDRAQGRARRSPTRGRRRRSSSRSSWSRSATSKTKLFAKSGGAERPVPRPRSVHRDDQRQRRDEPEDQGRRRDAGEAGAEVLSTTFDFPFRKGIPIGTVTVKALTADQ